MFQPYGASVNPLFMLLTLDLNTKTTLYHNNLDTNRKRASAAVLPDTDLKNNLYQAAVDHLHLTPLLDSV